MTKNQIIKFSDVVRRFDDFEAMRDAVDEFDSKIIDEITRLVFQSSAIAGWECGFEGEDYLRWWFAPPEWRRTSHKATCPYDFEMYFNITRGGFPCSGQWPLTPKFLGHMLGSNESRLVIRCFIHRMRTKSFIEMIGQQTDIMAPIIAAGWKFNVTDGYLEFPIVFSRDEIIDGAARSDIAYGLEPIVRAISFIKSDLTDTFARLLNQGLKALKT